MKNKLILKVAVFSVFIYILAFTACGGGGGGAGGASIPASEYTTHNPTGWGGSGYEGGSSSGGSGGGGSNVIQGGTPLSVTGYSYNGQTYSTLQELVDAISTDAFPTGQTIISFTCTTATGGTETRQAKVTKSASGNTIEHQYKAQIPIQGGQPVEILFYKNNGISVADIIAQAGLTPETVGDVTFPLENILIDGTSYPTGSTITADGDISFSTITGTCAKWGIDTSGNIEFSSALENGETVVINAQNIAKINIPTDKTVTLDLSNASMQDNKVDRYCFPTDQLLSRANLIGITLPAGLQTIDAQAFAHCTNLEAITIPDNVSSIGTQAFNECAALETITIPGGVTLIDINAFENCTGLQSVTFSSGVGTIGTYAFSGCTNLASINIGSVYAIGFAAFDGVGTDTTGVSVNFTNPSNLTTIGSMAFASSKLSGDLVLPDSVTTIEDDSFSNCNYLTSVTMPSVETIGERAFSACSNLTSVNMPIVQSIGGRAFQNCTKLKRVNSNTDNVINLPDTLESIGDSSFIQSFTETPAPDEFTLVLPNNNNFVIGSSAFANCTNITNIKAQNETFNNGSTDSSASYSNTNFGWCSRIKTLDLRACSDITIDSTMLQDTTERVTILTGRYDVLKIISLTDAGSTFTKTPLFQGCDANGNLVANDGGIAHFSNSYTWYLNGSLIESVVTWGGKYIYSFHDLYTNKGKLTGWNNAIDKHTWSSNEQWPPAGE